VTTTLLGGAAVLAAPVYAVLGVMAWGGYVRRHRKETDRWD
jgi:hypothetical protein